jgi:hypothetical protein
MPPTELGAARAPQREPTRKGSVNRTATRRRAPSKNRTAADSLRAVPGAPRPSPEVTGLIERIRELVAEHRRLEMSASTELLERYRREIARLQRRLASAVKRELAH